MTIVWNGNTFSCLGRLKERLGEYDPSTYPYCPMLYYEPWYSSGPFSWLGSIKL